MVIGKSATAILFQRSAFNSAIRAVFWNSVAEQRPRCTDLHCFVRLRRRQPKQQPGRRRLRRRTTACPCEACAPWTPDLDSFFGMSGCGRRWPRFAALTNRRIFACSPKRYHHAATFSPFKNFYFCQTPRPSACSDVRHLRGLRGAAPSPTINAPAASPKSQMVWPDAEERWATFQAVDIEPRYSDTVDPTNCAERVPTIIGNHSVYGAIHQQSEWRV